MQTLGALEAGGTKMVMAIFSDDGTMQDRVSIPTMEPETTMPEMIRYFASNHVSAVGIGCFGPLDLNPASPHLPEGAAGTHCSGYRCEWCCAGRSQARCRQGTFFLCIRHSRHGHRRWCHHQRKACTRAHAPRTGAPAHCSVS